MDFQQVEELTKGQEMLFTAGSKHLLLTDKRLVRVSKVTQQYFYVEGSHQLKDKRIRRDNLKSAGDGFYRLEICTPELKAEWEAAIYKVKIGTSLLKVDWSKLSVSDLEKIATIAGINLEEL